MYLSLLIYLALRLITKLIFMFHLSEYYFAEYYYILYHVFIIVRGVITKRRVGVLRLIRRYYFRELIE